MTNINKKGSVFYARTSTEEQADKRTIESQIEANKKSIRENGETLVDEYVDDGYSGSTLDRPQLERLRNALRERTFDKIYIYSPDRLSRELHNQLFVMKEFRKYGVEIIFISQKFDDNPYGNLLFQMVGSIAEFERAQILDRTRRGKLHKVKNGILLGSIPPFGYHYIKKSETAAGKYEINKEEAETVRLIFKIFNSPSIEGIRTLSKELLRLGVRTRGGSTKWANSSLSRIIKNSTYIGTTFWNKYAALEPLKESSIIKYKRLKNSSRRLRSKEEWIPIRGVPVIISEKEFVMAQEKLRRNAALSIRNTKYSYLLTGLSYCGCGKRFYGYPCHGKPRYKCSDKYLKYPLPKTCQQGTIDTNILDEGVWSAFLKTLESPEVVTSRINGLLTNEKDKKEEVEIQIQAIDKNLALLATQEQRLIEAYTEQVFSLEQLKNQRDVLENKRKVLIEKRKQLEADLIKQTPALSNQEVEDYFNRIKQRATSANFELRKQIIKLFVDKVAVQGSNVNIKAFLPPKASLLSSQSQEIMSSCCCDCECSFCMLLAFNF